MRIILTIVAVVAFVAGAAASLGSPDDFSIQASTTNEIPSLAEQHPHVNRSVIEIIELHGYPSEVHRVVTADDYVLELHRIPGNADDPSPKGKPVVLLMHGLICSSAVFVLAGPGSGLGFFLADAGYDVWMGNVRGSKYSRKHLHKSTLEPDYWDFSWHEIGTRDVPATIDYILDKTGKQKLSYVGHSQGSTVFFVTLSELPEYNDKISSMFSLAGITFCSNMFSPFLRMIAKFSNSLRLISEWIGKYEFAPSDGFFRLLSSIFCKHKSPLQPFCKNFLFMMMGFNDEQMDKALLPVIADHLPAGAGVKQFIHYGQIIKSGYFRQYDYGKRNKEIYGQGSPPSYNLKKVRVPVSVHYSSNDWVSDSKDAEILYSQLTNKIGKFRVPDDKFNHVDFVWAKDVKVLLYHKLLSLMSRYN